MHSQFVRVGDVNINVVVDGAGPLILCVHGWPELSHSWRHQMAHFATRGFTVAALDVRGYGRSDKPWAVAAYTMRTIAADVAAVIDALGGGPAILFGHDWGAPIVYATTLLYPEKVRAVAGLSVPHMPQTDTSFLAMLRMLYKDRFFYQLYFQAEGVAEQEFGRDPRTALLKLYGTKAGSGDPAAFSAGRPDERDMLSSLPVPPLPDWLSEADLSVYVEAFCAGGWRGPLNRYRAQELDYAARADLVGQRIAQPAVFIGGSLDPVRRFVPGADLFADTGAGCADFRGATIVPGAGHWVQQEAADAVNAALEVFVGGL